MSEVVLDPMEETMKLSLQYSILGSRPKLIKEGVQKSADPNCHQSSLRDSTEPDILFDLAVTGPPKLKLVVDQLRGSPGACNCLENPSKMRRTGALNSCTKKSQE